MARRNKLVNPQSEQALEKMKEEIATELGIHTGADATARENGKVGGEMTKRLIQMAEDNLQ
jgi:hypothetical protein